MERGGWRPGVRSDARSRVRNLTEPQAHRHEHRQRRQNPDVATGTVPPEVNPHSGRVMRESSRPVSGVSGSGTERREALGQWSGSLADANGSEVKRTVTPESGCLPDGSLGMLALVWSGGPDVPA